MIVLTDGKSNPIGPDEAVAEAGLAKADGITMFTIGLGRPDDLDAEALSAMASRPGYRYLTPDADDLAEIYAQIARSIPCPGERFWP
jgi:hypothetical protein